MNDFIEVNMQVTEKTINIANKLRSILHTDNNAEVVGVALATLNLIIDSINPGGDLLIRKKNGDMYKIDIPGLEYA
jgi:hypothetical protein